MSPTTVERLDVLFQGDERQLVAATLTEYCGHGLPSCSTPENVDLIERIRFGCLKLSEGSLDKLDDALDLAADDWRNLLASAGFADDVEEHLRWRP